MGDEYVLENFGRSGNTYAKSALKIVKDNITQRPEDVKRLLDTMKEHLNTSAAKLIHSGSTSKYTSVNTKDGYIEFRSPGGDWLNSNFDKIETTLLRFVVAMDAAVDETKYKEEYAKKLYKLLAGNDKDATNTMVYFAKYAAGELPQSALKSFIKQAQFERKAGKEPYGKKMWYRVDKEGRGKSGASFEVVATSKEEALEKAASNWNLKLSALSAAAVYPVRKFEGNDSSGPKYEIFNLNTNRSVEEVDGINNDREALIRLNDYLEHGSHGLQSGQARNMFGIRRVGGNGEPILATPFRARSGEPQPAGSVGLDTEISSPTGQWKIIDGLGRELYRFRPAQNTETKAKALAAAWAQDGQFDGNYQVVPVGHNDSTPRPIPGVTDIEPDISTSSPRTDRPFVWKVIGSSESPYQRQGVEVVASSEVEAMKKARQQWNLNTSGSTEEDFFRTNGWTATPVRPAPAQGSTTDLQQQRATPGTFTGAWKIIDNDGNEMHRFSGIGNNQRDANRVAINWLTSNGYAYGTEIEVVPIMS